MSLCYGWNCDCWRCQDIQESPQAPARTKVEVGEFCGMQINGSKPFRVLVVSSPELDERKELRAEVVVIEENKFVKVGSRCRPLASTLCSLNWSPSFDTGR